MEINVKALKQLLEERFDGNQSAFAKVIGVERTHLNKVFKSNGKGAGAVFCGAVIKFCNANGLNYKDYIFLN